MTNGFEQRLGRLVDQLNATLRTLLDAQLARAPETEHPIMQRIYRSVYAYLENGGKRMHGISQVLAYRAVGGQPPDSIFPIAAAFQLYHHHTLVHDDIYDDDAERRGSPTIAHAFSDWFKKIEPSSNVKSHRSLFQGESERRGAVAGFVQGKIVHAIAFEAVCKSAFPASDIVNVVQALNWHDLHDNAGQMKDVYHEGSRIPSPEACLEIARLKTGRLFAISVEAAARLGGASPPQVEALVQWILAAAVAYQLQDDLEDLEKESEKGLGRGVGTDLLTAKPTLILSLALESAGHAERHFLEDWLRFPEIRSKQLETMIEVLRATNALALCRARVSALIQESERALARATPALDLAIAEEMVQFAHYFVSPNYWHRALPPSRHPFVG